MLVFGKAMEASEGVLEPDRVVLVRGRVDHKDASKTCLIVQEAELFEPDAEEVEAARAKVAAAAVPPEPVRVRVDAGRLPAAIIDELKDLLKDFGGECEVVLEMQTAGGPRRLRLGPEYRVTPSASLRSSLEHLLGPAVSTAA